MFKVGELVLLKWNPSEKGVSKSGEKYNGTLAVIEELNAQPFYSGSPRSSGARLTSDVDGMPIWAIYEFLHKIPPFDSTKYIKNDVARPCTA